MNSFFQFVGSLDYLAWLLINLTITAFFAAAMSFTKWPEGLKSGILVNVAFAIGVLAAFLKLF